MSEINIYIQLHLKDVNNKDILYKHRELYSISYNNL